MRISDWSSDVCSSDLRLAAFIRASIDAAPGETPRIDRGYQDFDTFYGAKGRYDALMTCNAWTGAALRHAGVRVGAWTPFPATVMGRSEEHTSELQSLLRISYAVFCLQKTITHRLILPHLYRPLHGTH